MRAANRKIERPPREELAKVYGAGSCRSSGKHYGVSGATVFKWLRQLGIPRHGGNGRWARDWDRCQNPECGTDERPHKSLGYCERCYRRLIHYPREKRGECRGTPIYQFNPVVLQERYDEPLSKRALGKAYGVSEGTIERAFRRYGIESRPRGGARFIRGRDGWAKNYDCCVECGTDEIPHKAFGLCEKCLALSRRVKPATEFEDLTISPLVVQAEVPKLTLKVLPPPPTPEYICERCGYEHHT